MSLGTKPSMLLCLDLTNVVGMAKCISYFNIRIPLHTKWKRNMLRKLVESLAIFLMMG